MARILGTGSCVEASGESRVDDPRNSFPKLFFPQGSLSLAVVGLEQGMGLGCVCALTLVCSIACPKIQDKKMCTPYPLPTQTAQLSFPCRQVGKRQELGNNLFLSGHEIGMQLVYALQQRYSQVSLP